MVIGLSGVAVCNHIDEWLQNRSLIHLSRVWLQTELDDTKSNYRSIMTIRISEKRGIAKSWKKGKFALNDGQRVHKLLKCDLNYNFECDRLIELSDNNLASELVENGSFFKPIAIEEIVFFMIMNF